MRNENNTGFAKVWKYKDQYLLLVDSGHLGRDSS